MKISKYILLGSMAIMGAGLSSCGSDWLDISNNTQDPVEEYYTNQDNIWQSVVAAYDPCTGLTTPTTTAASTSIRK